MTLELPTNALATRECSKFHNILLPVPTDCLFLISRCGYYQRLLTAILTHRHLSGTLKGSFPFERPLKFNNISATIKSHKIALRPKVNKIKAPHISYAELQVAKHHIQTLRSSTASHDEKGKIRTSVGCWDYKAIDLFSVASAKNRFHLRVYFSFNYSDSISPVSASVRAECVMLMLESRIVKIRLHRYISRGALMQQFLCRFREKDVLLCLT